MLAKRFCMSDCWDAWDVVGWPDAAGAVAKALGASVLIGTLENFASGLRRFPATTEGSAAIEEFSLSFGFLGLASPFCPPCDALSAWAPC